MTRKEFDRFRERAVSLLRSLYVERQFFLRSNRGVRFISLSARTQVWMTVGALALAVWIGIGSLSLFGEEKRFERENRELRAELRTTITAYESRLAGMQSDSRNRIEALDREYQDLQARFAELRQSFFSAVDALETRQQRLRMSLDRYGTLETPFNEESARLRAQLMERPPANSNRLLASARKLPRPLMQSRITPLSLQPGAAPPDTPHLPENEVRHVGLQGDLQRRYPHIAGLADMGGAADSALRRLDVEQSHLISAVEEWIEEDISRMERILVIAGLSPQFVPPLDQARDWRESPQERGSGGPLVAEAGRIADNIWGQRSQTPLVGYDPSAERQLARIADNLERLNALQDAIESLPLAMPLGEETFSLSSGYGMRDDPFSGERAFHGGLDFSAPYKSPALAAAAGVVTRVGWSGAYGRIVDIDHGNGVVTRYGHLARFLVEKGDEVVAQQPIGLIGSSGRSTGAHLHYEIRVGGRAMNPWRFLKAGHYVVAQNVASQR